jgi:uncharacterized phage-like protein YoqJ
LHSVKSVCFTGHRDLSKFEIALLKRRLNIIHCDLIENHGTVVFNAGGALGFDTLAAGAVIDLKPRYPHIKLSLLLPCATQDKNWNNNDRLIYSEIKANADTVRILSPFYYNGCMQSRNKELLLSSDFCVSYLRSGTTGGGTLNTVLQASRLNIPTINLALSDMEVL